jgi:lysine/ornithine N-monooxygenase
MSKKYTEMTEERERERERERWVRQCCEEQTRDLRTAVVANGIRDFIPRSILTFSFERVLRVSKLLLGKVADHW